MKLNIIRVVCGSGQDIFLTVCKGSHSRQYAKIAMFDRINRPELKKIRQYAETALFANTQLPQILRLEKETKK